MRYELNNAKWFFQPNCYKVTNETVTIITNPNTDFWQRTYYGFRNDNAHVFYQTVKEDFFTFTVKASFNYKNLFDQCGIVIYQDSENWVKGGIEYHNENKMWLGSVVTNQGFSDWATCDIGAEINTMWYRISRRKSDFLIENSFDGVTYQQMRIFHLAKGDEPVNLGIMACSPGESSFEATFSEITLSSCLWEAHK